MPSIFRGSMESTRSVERTRTAMDCITNTHDTVVHRTRAPNGKNQSSVTVHISSTKPKKTPTQVKERKQEPLPVPSQVQSSKDNDTFAETVRDSMLRRGYQVVFPDYFNNGLPDLQSYPLQINVTSASTLFDITDRFENPRKAPLPHGLKYNTQNSNCPATPANITGRPYRSVLMIDMRVTEFNDLSQASIFCLPRFNPEKELKTLQNLWSRRGSLGPPPHLLPSSKSPILAEPTERSFFESDSDSEEDSKKRYCSWGAR